MKDDLAETVPQLQTRKLTKLWFHPWAITNLAQGFFQHTSLDPTNPGEWLQDGQSPAQSDPVRDQETVYVSGRVAFVRAARRFCESF